MTRANNIKIYNVCNGRIVKLHLCDDSFGQSVENRGNVT
jgi:hypothetical protein